MHLRSLAASVLALLLAACGDTARLPEQTGPNPQLPPPTRTMLPTVHIAPAEGWPAGRMPVVPKGFAITALARQLSHPR